MEKKAPDVDQLSTNSILYGILFEMRERNELLTQIERELSLANALKKMELIAAAYRFDNLNEEARQDYLSKVNNFFSMWRST